MVEYEASHIQRGAMNATSSCASSKHKAVSHQTVGRRSYHLALAEQAGDAELLAVARRAEAHEFILSALRPTTR
jgi:hypothetical protein